MKKIKLSPLLILLLASYILIEGSFDPLWFLFFSLLHELGHILAIRWRGGGIGGLIGGGQGFGLTVNGLSYRDEFLVALAGPIVSLLLAGVFALAGHGFFCYANLALGLMNLLPIFPLDGGRMLRAFLAEHLSPDRQRKITQSVGLIFIFPLLGLAFWQFLSSGYNLSLLFVCLYLIGLIKENGNDV